MNQEEPKRRGRPAKSESVELESVELESLGVRVFASLGVTLNVGDHEFQKLDIGVSGIPVDATQEFIDDQLSKATITLHTVVDSLAKEMGRRLREDYGR